MAGPARVRVALLLAITFMAGMAAGVAADRQLRVNAEADAAPADDSLAATHENIGRSRAGRATIERFADDLGLTEEQRAEIAPIIEDARRRMSDLFAPVRPAYGEIVDSAKARIEAILTPEQVTEYRRLLESEYGAGDGRGRSVDRTRENAVLDSGGGTAGNE